MPCAGGCEYGNAGSLAVRLVREKYPHVLEGSTAFLKLVEKHRRKINRSVS